MWIFTNVGYISIVENSDNSNEVMLRARARKDLDTFRTLYLPTNAPKVKFYQTNDYPYRITIKKEDCALAMANAVRNIDYANFKSSVTKKQGWERSSIYMKIWSLLMGIEKDKGRINHYFSKFLPEKTGSKSKPHTPTYHEDDTDWRSGYRKLRNRYGYDTNQKLLPFDSRVVHSDD